MKKTKILMPLLGISSIAAVAVPLVSCNGPSNSADIVLDKFINEIDLPSGVSQPPLLTTQIKNTLYEANTIYKATIDLNKYEGWDPTKPAEEPFLCMFMLVNLDDNNLINEGGGSGIFDTEGKVIYNGTDIAFGTDTNEYKCSCEFDYDTGTSHIQFILKSGKKFNKDDTLSIEFKLTENKDTVTPTCILSNEGYDPSHS